MSEPTRLPTLLPYLRTGDHRVQLNFVRSAHQSQHAAGIQNPFRILMESTPLSRLVEASWVTDAGSAIQGVLMACQRDVYPWSGRDAARLANPAVEAIWQQTYAICSHESPDDLMMLDEQVDEARRLVPFQSLFYCREKRHFFHPPCPQCGKPLLLCQDDARLSAAQLSAYTRSLRRYLYCPSCFEIGASGTFYTYELGPYDPPSVTDRFGLILEFARVPSSPDSASNLLCGECDHRQTCFGATPQATGQILPFSFYPFYCLFFREKPLNSSELLIFLSGGTFEDIRESLQQQGEVGRLQALERLKPMQCDRDGFLLRGDERFFLELLYLKLCFLEEALGMLQRAGSIAQTVDAVATLEQLWASLPERAGHLPWCWSFGLHVADVLTPRLGTGVQASGGARGVLYSLGMAWFHVLAANAHQDASRVSAALEDLLDHHLSMTGPSENDPPWDLAGSLFRAENIKWHGDAVVPASCREVWKEALHLGWTLLVASQTSARDWSWAAFEWQSDALREKVRAELFSAEKRLKSVESVVQATGTPSESEAIHDILDQIRKTWRERAAAVTSPEPERELKAPPGPVSEADTLPLGVQWNEEEDELLETVVIAQGETLEPDTTESQPVAPQIPPEELLPETIILTPSGPGSTHTPGPQTPSRSSGGEQPPRTTREASRGGEPVEARDQAVDEPTEVVSVPKWAARPSPQDVEAPGFPDADTLPTPPPLEEDKEKEEETTGDDLLMETIILTPKKGPEPPEKK